MKKNILYTLALLSIFASCAKTELPHFGGENDPDAVVISPSVAVLSSKSNPLGEDNEQLRSFNEGDIITIKDLSDNEVYTIEMLMNQAGVTIHDRKVVDAALEYEKITNGPAAAIELHDGRIIKGKTSKLLGATAAMLLNALKDLAGIEHSCHVISPEAIEPIQTLKTKYLGNKNPRLHTDEVLIALSVSAASNPLAKKALEQLPNLAGCQAHTSVMVSSVDIKQLKRLSIQATYEAKYEKRD